MHAITWLSLAISVASACFTGAGWWTGREKLRLDLYNRRFDIYSRVLDFVYALDDWNPTEAERNSSSLQDSADLVEAQRAFIKATRESQFLFKDNSGVHKLLEQMHADSAGIIGYKRDIARNAAFVGPDVPLQFNEFLKKKERIRSSIPPLEQAMSAYLDFHKLSLWKWN